MELAVVQLLVSGILALFPGIQAGVKSFVSSLTAQLPDLFQSGADVSAFVAGELSRVKTMIAENRDPTQEEWDALNATVANELAYLNAQAAKPDDGA
jgi:hypothetical protein